MPDLYELTAEELPACRILLNAVDGWIDAGSAAAQARDVVIAGAERRTIALFDADDLIDHQARRPVLHLRDGINVGVDLPRLALELLTPPESSEAEPFLLLSGPEPDHRWVAFTNAVVDLAQRCGVSRVVGLGAYPAPTPHTRPARVVATATAATLAELVGFVPGLLDVPAGVSAVLEQACGRAGIEAVGLWVQVPHYVSNLSYPAAALALVDALNVVSGSRIDGGTLRAEAVASRSRIDDLVAQNDEHRAMVRQLEILADEQLSNVSLPSADELADELEQFLRSQGEPGT